jgi:hypothetical protein
MLVAWWVLSDWSALLIGFFRDFACFFANVAGLFPLSAVYFGSFITRARTLLFAYLAGGFLETLGVFFLARLF